jgi:transposase
MRTDYSQTITESVEDLARHERALRGHAPQARVRMLRLLTAGTAASLPMCAPLVGYSLRQLNRWWARYQAQGLTGLLADKPRPGTTSKLTPAAYAALEEQMRAGQVARLEDARRYLAEQWGITYGSVSGVWWQLRKRTAKPKTGRRRHRQADGAAQAAFTQGGSASS